MTRAANSGEPAASSGTARTPRSRQPKKAPTHSAEFSPHRTTRSPGDDAAPDQLGGESAGKGRKVGVGDGVTADAAVAHDGDLPAVAAEIVDQAGQMRTHENRSPPSEMIRADSQSFAGYLQRGLLKSDTDVSANHYGN